MIKPRAITPPAIHRIINMLFGGATVAGLSVPVTCDTTALLLSSVSFKSIFTVAVSPVKVMLMPDWVTFELNWSPCVKSRSYEAICTPSASFTNNTCLTSVTLLNVNLPFASVTVESESEFRMI